MVRAPPVTSLEGVEIGRVPGAFRADAVRLLNESFSPCGCARTVASCLANRDVCPCPDSSARLAEFVIARYERGLSTAQVEADLVGGLQEAFHARPYAFDLSDQPSLGPDDAPHIVVEFADFSCKHCRDGFKSLVRFAGGRSDVRLVYFYFPLAGFGEPSLRAARAAEAARRQGKFWEMAALLYEAQGAFEPADLLSHAERIGLDRARFETDIASDETMQAVMADKSVGTAAGVQGTPAVFVNGRPLGLSHDSADLAARLGFEGDRDECR